MKVPGLTGFYEFSLHVVKEDEDYNIQRRYSDFLLLRKALEVTLPGLFIFPLPPKDTFLQFQKEDSISVQKRKQGIVNFLDAI